MTHPFTDVPDGAYYADAVEWAWANGITTGVSSTEFGPELAVTRAQLVTMLHRFNREVTTREQWLAVLDRLMVLEDGVTLPQPEPPDPPTRGPVWVPAFGGGEIGIRIPDGFPHPDDYKGLPLSTIGVDTLDGRGAWPTLPDGRILIEGYRFGTPEAPIDAGWIIGARNNGQRYAVRNCELWGTVDIFKAAVDVDIEDVFMAVVDSPDLAHPDCVQHAGGGSVRVKRATMVMRHQNSNSCVRAVGVVGKAVFDAEECFFVGGSRTLQFEPGKHGCDARVRRSVLAGGSTSAFRTDPDRSDWANLDLYVINRAGAAIDCSVLPESEWRVDR